MLIFALTEHFSYFVFGAIVGLFAFFLFNPVLNNIVGSIGWWFLRKTSLREKELATVLAVLFVICFVAFSALAVLHGFYILRLALFFTAWHIGTTATFFKASRKVAMENSDSVKNYLVVCKVLLLASLFADPFTVDALDKIGQFALVISTAITLIKLTIVYLVSPMTAEEVQNDLAQQRLIRKELC